MASCNPINFIIWLLILLFISFFVAGFCAPFYILIYTISAFISSLGDIANTLLKGVQFPYYCAKQMMS